MVDLVNCAGGVLVLLSTLPHMNTLAQAPLRPSHPQHAPWVQRLTASAAWPRVMGALAVLMFALTIPMTRLANGSVDAPHLPPLFVAVARGAAAGVLSLLYLWWAKAPLPQRGQWAWLLAVVLGGVLTFPLCMGWAVRVVPASHAAVVTGLLPLTTASLAAWWLGHRPRLGFWLASAAGAALILSFVGWSARGSAHTLSIWADGAMLLSLVGASVAYVAGARLTQHMPSAQVMSWSLVLAWPLTASLSLWWWPAGAGPWLHGIPGSSLWALAYVSVLSTWLGFFFWYAALARDAMRVSQIQLLQPFGAMAASAVLLGEVLQPVSLLFALAVLCVVLLGQRLARPATAAPAPR